MIKLNMYFIKYIVYKQIFKNIKYYQIYFYRKIMLNVQEIYKYILVYLFINKGEINR